ncbi:MAG: hypothetical protein HZA46_05835 [Planctomycetales bacterium]|nr:hypothetical protein [Planctomycetales bacterium]
MFATAEVSKLMPTDRKPQSVLLSHWATADENLAPESTANIHRQEHPRDRPMIDLVRHHDWRRFCALWLLIGVVSAIDVYLTLRFRDDLLYNEENRIGLYLMKLNGGDPSLFLSLKFLGTILSLGILVNVFLCRPKWGMLVAKCVAAFQVGLLMYLTLA